MFRQLVNSISKVPMMVQSVRHMAEYTGPREKCMNIVQLLGRVGADPVVRSGDKYQFVTFDMATSSQYPKKNYAGEVEYITKTEWHSVNVFRPGLVDKVEKFVQKGTRLLVNGSLEYNVVEKDGRTVEYPKVVCEDVIILASPKEYNEY